MTKERLKWREEGGGRREVRKGGKEEGRGRVSLFIPTTNHKCLVTNDTFHNEILGCTYFLV